MNTDHNRVTAKRFFELFSASNIDGALALFESGAIVFHIVERHTGLLPGDAIARARAITWMFAALSTIEPPIVERASARLV